MGIKISGIELENPLILASGILGSTGSSLNRIARTGAGAVVSKSIGMESREGYEGPVLLKVDCGFLNALGLPNPSYKNFIEELEDFDRYCPLIISVFGSSSSEFVEVAEDLEDYADAFELNLSCPHVEGYGMEIGRDLTFVEDITREFKRSISRPTWVKLTPNVGEITEIGLAAEKGGADAVVAINTVKGLRIDVESGYPLLGNVYGGLSGRCIKPIGLAAVYSLYKKLKIPIIGVGGIEDYRDVLEYLMAGARCIEIGSALYYDLEIFKEIDSDLKRHLEENSLEMEDIIGLAHRKRKRKRKR
ncbi:MAG: dihydroorotate dehydrogenase 1B [Candidatus Methanolliviera sp. GoM_asphalt]|nr:MAG: dihydroorotate dehydrogenase 1B [Candidatus Methanolliviera sp. GoM_asphalt]